MADEQPIIIRRKKGGHGGHHGGAWKVAFADFMTAMMAFFLVMWLVGQKPEVREAVSGYFRDPGKYQQQGGAGFLKGSKSPIPQKDPAAGLLKTESEKKGSGAAEVERSQMKQAALKIISELEKQEAFRNLRENVKIQLTSEGLRIILNESEHSPAFFEPGSAKLLQKSAVILMTIAGELGKIDNRLVIEGHTDAAFTGDNVYTNWELSADRANAARELMVAHGLYDGQVREVRGFADQFPMIVEDPANARNRRVTIVVLYEHVAGQYDQMEVGADLLAEADE